MKNLSKYHDLYLKSNVLLLSDVFENVTKICLEIYEFDAAKFISAPGLAWQAALKKTQVKLDLITDFDMILMFKNVLEVKYVIESTNTQKPISI